MISQYANKAKRKELADKSEKINGRRSYYQRLMRERLISIEEVEKVLDMMIERITEEANRYFKALEEKHESSKVSEKTESA